ncbi:WxL protein peptidoglycan domain-containing protein [Enterococcus mundtii]|uniref:DUF916 domain-containing protein n=1 Tax=Enterococcus mundtii TaxID=53346 RepID=A0A2S7RTV3_ENTMU|nr:DUF916 domain-containing protein [Enterococcus mundtii]PQF23115.1 DUF916 domain-containing protein [Enterococcus mundtii]
MKRSSQTKEYKFIDICSLIFVLLMGSFFYIQPVEASEEDTASILVDVQPKEYEIRDSYMQFTPELDKNYEFTATITNIGDKDLDVTVYPSVAISTMGSVTYVENTEKLLDEKYDFSKYVKITNANGELEDGKIKVEAKQSETITILINVTEELDGEVLGGVNFSQTLSEESHEDAVDIVHVYEKVILFHLKMDELEVEKEQTYDGFEFVSSQDAIRLDYFIANNDPTVTFAESGPYKVINPNGEIISEGEIEENTIALTPMTKTKLNLPLVSDAELMFGEYQFILTVDGKEKVTKFNYTKEELEGLIEQTGGSNKIIVNQGSNNWVIGLLLVFSALLIVTSVILYLKYKKTRIDS